MSTLRAKREQKISNREKRKNIVTRKWGDRRKGKTDWARVDALTDEDIARAVANDPDAVPIDIDWSDAVLVIPPKKKAISIRVDEDVLDYFKSEGDGYQRRINAVLRSYMQQKAKPKKRADGHVPPPRRSPPRLRGGPGWGLPAGDRPRGAT